MVRGVAIMLIPSVYP